MLERHPLQELAICRPSQPSQVPIADAKRELQAWSNHAHQVVEDPKEVVPVSVEMLTESAPEKLPAASGGKVHEILVKGDDFHPREWRTADGISVGV